jgi:tRNA (mo5U34)-methyltransferase
MTVLTKNLTESINRLGPWFHNIHLPDGTQTVPDHFLGDFPRWKWDTLAPHLPEDMTGWKVLDIGCNAGFYSIQLAGRGADVLGIDLNPHYLKQAAWAAEQFGLQDRIRLRQMQVYDLARIEEQFDLILFMGVLYHLRYPLLAMDIIARKVSRILVFQSLMLPGEDMADTGVDHGIHERDFLLEPGWPKMAFIEHRFNDDATNWWVPNMACAQAMLRSTGLEVYAQVAHETLLCRPGVRPVDVMDPEFTGEYQAATGLTPPA